MRLCLELRAAPEAESSVQALELAQALTASPAASPSTHLWKVFFVGDAAWHADTTHPAGRWQPWQQCAQSGACDLLVCSASAQRFSLLGDGQRFCEAFIPCGLAELACLPDDVRLISFNP